MIFAILFWEFFQIGLFAIGGGPVTIPFLFDLTEKYDWFTAQELTNIIAVSQSTPGPIGVNMATYAGFQTAGVLGGIVATFGLVLPSLFIIVRVSKFLRKFGNNPILCEVMLSIRPVVMALILMAGIDLMKISVLNYVSAIFAVLFFCLVYFYKKSPVFYILLSAILGIVLRL